MLPPEEVDRAEITNQPASLLFPTPDDPDPAAESDSPDPIDPEYDPASALDADIQQRADFVREALRVESNNRLTVKTIVNFLYPYPVVQATNPLTGAPEYHPPADSLESDPRAEEARVGTRIAAYERLERIFASDLPSRETLQECNERARWAAFSVPKDAMYDGEGE